MENEMEIKRFVAERLQQGIPLAKIQTMLAEEKNCRMTFLDLRLLAAELEDVDWSKFDPATPAKPEEKKDAAASADAPAAGTPGATVVEESKVARPGALAHGTVKFASGASAEWIVDQMGRLGLDKVNGEPTEADFQDFQKELQKLFGR